MFCSFAEFVLQMTEKFRGYISLSGGHSEVGSVPFGKAAMLGGLVT